MIENDDENIKELILNIDLNSECFDKSIEFSMIQAPVFYNKVAIRQSVTRNIALIPGAAVFHPIFKLEKVEDFRIAKIDALSNKYLNRNFKLKKLELIIIMEYNLLYTDGTNRIKQPDIAIFNLVLDCINYPDNNIKYFEKNYAEETFEMNNKNKLNIKVDALAEAFGDVICSCTGALILEIGAFFIINFECMTQLNIPTYKLGNVLLRKNI
ncbi:MAG: hypothetical protein K0S55_1088 [Clostridia bacterium]|nr:hypothetical protein [Clostridia bacterium]